MKNKLIVTALILVATMCVSLMSGCWVDSARIEFVEEPAETYYVGDTMGDFVIRDMDSKKEYRYSENKSLITVEGFATTAPGNYTAKVTFGDYTLNFDYTVIGTETGFAGGNGSLTAPYQIATPAQFQNMLYNGENNANKVYYELVADIDLAGKTLVQVSSPYYGDDTAEEASHFFNGIINGNGYKVMNIGNITTKQPELAKEKFNEIFGAVGANFALSNIEFNFAASGEQACTGLTSCVATYQPNAKVVFDNVKVTGYIDLSARNNTSIGVFMGQVDRYAGDLSVNNVKVPGSASKNASLEIKNCENEISLYNGSACHMVSAYINTQTASTITMTNNRYSGTIEGGDWYSAALIGMYNAGPGTSLANVSGNVVEDAHILTVNNSTVSGVYAVGPVNGSKVKNEDIKALNDATNVSVTTVAAGTVVKAEEGHTHTITGIASNVKTIRISYSTSFENGGCLMFAREMDVTGDTMTFTAPAILKHAFGATEPADMGGSKTAGIWFTEDEGGVVTAHINRIRGAAAVSNKQPAVLSVLAVGYDAEGNIVWTSGSEVKLNPYTVA